MTLPPLPGVAAILSRFREGGGEAVSFLPPEGPPAALFRAASVLPLPARLHRTIALPPGLREIPARHGPDPAPRPGDPASRFLDAVEALLERLGGETGCAVPEGALDRALRGEAAVAAFLSGLDDPAPWLDASGLLPPAALLLLAGRGSGGPLPPGEGRLRPPSPFRDGEGWDGRGDPRLFAALAWKGRAEALAVPAVRKS